MRNWLVPSQDEAEEPLGDRTRPQHSLLPPVLPFIPRDKPAAGRISGMAINSPEGPAGGLRRRHQLCGDTSQGTCLRHQQLLGNGVLG